MWLLQQDRGGQKAGTLIWDFDGTLAYRRGGMFGASLLEVARRAAPASEFNPDVIHSCLQTGFPWHRPEAPHPEIESGEAWWKRLYPVLERALKRIGFDASTARSLARQVRHVYVDPQRWSLFDDVQPTLDRLTAQGWQHVILSNHVPELGEIVRHLGLATQIARVFNSAETGYEKPHPRSFRTVIQQMPNSQAFWMIGDNMRTDIIGAAALGIPGILVRNQHEDAVFDAHDLSEVPPIVGQAPDPLYPDGRQSTYPKPDSANQNERPASERKRELR